MSENDGPDFGTDVSHMVVRCSPRELYRRLLAFEENVDHAEPAFRFAVAALRRAPAAPVEAATPEAFVDGLLDWARDEAASHGSPLTVHASSWPARVVREFAPTGLVDGAWLQGAVRANVVECPLGMAALKQLMLRCGDPGTRESYVERYAALLRSVGTAPAAIARWEPDESAVCADISYEHALLGMTLGLFPQSFGAEMLGYNLWVTAVGPCPLLQRLEGELREKGASLRYLELYERDALRRLAAEAIVVALQERPDDPAVRRRVASGFAAAHDSHGQWEAAMHGRNVPMTARQFVLEAIRRKAHFAVGHHGTVRLQGASIDELLAGDSAAHSKLLEHLARSRLVRPGRPDESLLLTRTISIDGPMFDVFTASEQLDLREWIAGLPEHGAEAGALAREPVALSGEYGPPQSLDGLRNYAFARYSTMPVRALCYELANADRFPAVRLFARGTLEFVLSRLASAFVSDPVVRCEPPPPWSERALAEIVRDRHRRNIESRANRASSAPAAPPSEVPPIKMAFDGIWLQGFADVTRIPLEEYGWLFRIYASEQGDGNLAWNHNTISRNVHLDKGPKVLLPATDAGLYASCQVTALDVLEIAMSLDTVHFLPEVLGLNLAIEASGVGGSYIDGWKSNIGKDGNPWLALTYRLHNSIDNYATGHTKWSLAAVQAFMTRVADCAPQAVEAQWNRVWRMWRVHEILLDGTEAERAALEAAVGVPF